MFSRVANLVATNFSRRLSRLAGFAERREQDSSGKIARRLRDEAKGVVYPAGRTEKLTLTTIPPNDFPFLREAGNDSPTWNTQSLLIGTAASMLMTVGCRALTGGF